MKIDFDLDLAPESSGVRVRAKTKRTQPEKPEEERSDRTVRNPAGARKREAAEHSRRKQIDGTAGSTKPAPRGQGELYTRFWKHRATTERSTP